MTATMTESKTEHRAAGPGRKHPTAASSKAEDCRPGRPFEERPKGSTTADPSSTQDDGSGGGGSSSSTEGGSGG